MHIINFLKFIKMKKNQKRLSPEYLDIFGNEEMLSLKGGNTPLKITIKIIWTSKKKKPKK